MNVDEIKELIQAVSNSEITQLKYKDEYTNIVLSKQANVVTQTECVKPVLVENTVAAPAAPKQDTTSVEQKAAGSEKVITSPLVGTVYMAPEENGEPFVKVGDTVKKGQVVAIVEAMKLMNEIECEQDGVIAEVLVENGQVVSYGQPLFALK